MNHPQPHPRPPPAPEARAPRGNKLMNTISPFNYTPDPEVIALALGDPRMLVRPPTDTSLEK